MELGLLFVVYELRSHVSVDPTYETQEQGKYSPAHGNRLPMNNTHLKSIIWPRSLGKCLQLPNNGHWLISFVNIRYPSEFGTISAICIWTSYTSPDWTIPGLVSRQWQGILLFSETSRPPLCPTRSPIQWVSELFFLGGKWTGRDADHSNLSCADIKKELGL
jgi:hypothetical protein